MLYTPRIAQLAETPDKNSNRRGDNSPYIRWQPSLLERKVALRKAADMHLVHQKGTVKVGEVVR